MTVTNINKFPLELAVWVVHDDYDFISQENTISATTLMKPLRQIILPSRIAPGGKLGVDVEELIQSALGNAIHAAIQRAWEHGNHRRALRLLGYSDSVIERVLVNPTPEQLAAVKDPIPVYVEQRATKTIMVDGVEFTISGKFDMVPNGRITDTKATSVYSWILDRKDDDYRLQMSFYRWLNPDKVTEDHGRINFVFTDWSKLDAKKRKDYPKRLDTKNVLLLSMAETEEWIRSKIKQILRYRNSPESELPECTDEELWMGSPTYKYYSKPETALVGGKSTKNFDTQAEAEQHLREKGKGVVKTVKGTPRRCGYCSAFPVCSQKDQYDHD